MAKRTPSLPASTALTAFSIDVHSVTNRDFLEFVEAGGYGRAPDGSVVVDAMAPLEPAA